MPTKTKELVREEDTSARTVDPPKRTPARVSLDELAAGKLPQHVVAAINAMDITIAELMEWEASKGTLYIAVKDGHLAIEIQTRIPVKKVLAILGSLSGLLLVVTRLEVFQYIAAFANFLLKPG